MHGFPSEKRRQSLQGASHASTTAYPSVFDVDEDELDGGAPALVSSRGTPKQQIKSMVSARGTPKQKMISMVSSRTHKQKVKSMASSMGTPKLKIKSMVSSRGTPKQKTKSMVSARGTPKQKMRSMVSSRGTPKQKVIKSMASSSGTPKQKIESMVHRRNSRIALSAFSLFLFSFLLFWSFSHFLFSAQPPLPRMISFCPNFHCTAKMESLHVYEENI